MGLSAGQKVARQAARYLGESERPAGSNRGANIDRWQKTWGMGYGWPWCAAYADAMYAESGVDDDGLGHPSTAVMYQRAIDRGAVVTDPVPGAFILWPGKHVGICADFSPDGKHVVTYEGNSGDAIRQRVREYGPGTGAVIVAPKSVRQQAPAAASKQYYVEDPGAAPVFRGPWKTRAMRDVAIARLPEDRRKRVRRVRTKRGYGFYEGPRRVYGPWADKSARDFAAKVLATRLGRKVRPYSVIRKSSLRADSLGKTT